MAGFLSSFMLAGLLAASPDVFTFDGPEVTARTVGSVGFFTQGASPFTDLFERGQGSALLVARERIADPRATYGDAGSLEAFFQIGGTSYRVELERVGFPPAQALGGQPVTGPLPPPPAQPIAGGVVMNQDLHGTSGLGVSSMPRMRAAAAVWGVGRVWRDGELLTDTALIHAAALSHGVHADDETFRVLASARPGDTELYVMAWNLPREAEPRGFIQFGFDDVVIDVGGLQVPAVSVVPSAGALVGAEPPTTPVPGGASLGAVPNSALSVVPLVPAVPGPEFSFGGPRVTAGLVRTPDPQQAATPAVPLVSTPQPLNAQPPLPLVSTPQPLNAQPLGGGAPAP